MDSVSFHCNVQWKESFAPGLPIQHWKEIHIAWTDKQAYNV